MSLRRLLPIVLLAVAGLTAVAGPAAAARPAAPTLLPLTFTAATQSLTSSTGKQLSVSITAVSRSVPVGPVGERVESMTISLRKRGSTEQHSWALALPVNTGFSFDPEAAGQIATRASIVPFGAVSLRLTPTGRVTKVGCGRTRANVQQVIVSGTVLFHTRSTGHAGWGTIDAVNRTFTGRSVIAILDPADKLCGSTLPPCTTVTSWLANQNVGSDSTELQGAATTVGSTTTDTVSGQRITHLSRPANGVRTDSRTVKVPDLPFSFPGSGARLHLVNSSRAVTGSATMTGSDENIMPKLACGAPGQRTQTTSWTGAWRNGSKPLTLHEDIEGGFHVPAATFAQIERTQTS
jgi:hypothetical protein